MKFQLDDLPHHTALSGLFVARGVRQVRLVDIASDDVQPESAFL